MNEEDYALALDNSEAQIVVRWAEFYAGEGRMEVEGRSEADRALWRRLPDPLPDPEEED